MDGQAPPREIDPLLRAGRKLALIADPEQLLQEIPRVALEVVPADVAALVVRGSDGLPQVKAHLGASLEDRWPWMAGVVQRVFHDSRPRLEHDDPERARERPGRGRLLVVPFRGFDRKAALLVGRIVSQRELRDDQLPSLSIVAALSSESLRRARARSTSVARTQEISAWMNASREGVLFLDRQGRITGMNEIAGQLLAVDTSSNSGALLDDITGLEPLASATGKQAALGEGVVIELHGRDLRLRLRPHNTGSLTLISEERGGDTRGFFARYSFDDLVTEDVDMHAALATARQAAARDVPVLITGESGTGKEMLAQAIHKASTRAAHPFVAVNVAAIPEELLESELFGYEAGAFTGARAKGKPGSFELAASGTILLDEIGEMAGSMQAKLLRVLQERVVMRLGGVTPTRIHARVIATTNRKLEEEVDQGRFRLDLYHRLRVVHIALTPLRYRPMDIPVLARYFAERICERLERPRVRITPGVMTELQAARWPGNARELQNVLLGAISLLPEDQQELDELPIFRAHPEYTPVAARPRESNPLRVVPLQEVEREAIAHAMVVCDGNMSKAAKALGISRTTLYNKVKQYALST